MNATSLIIVAHLTEPGRRGCIDTLIGPDVVTKRQQVADIAAAIGVDIAVDQVTPEEARRYYRGQGGFAADNADFLFGFESYDGVLGQVDEPGDVPPGEDHQYKTLKEATGRPARSFSEWARDHADDFAGPLAGHTHLTPRASL